MTEPRSRFLPAFAGFTRDFLRWGGRRALWAGALLGAGAVLESLSLLMLIPILGFVVDTRGPGVGGWRGALAALFDAVGATSPFERLAILIMFYGVVILVRGAVIAAREVQLGALQIGFVQHHRARLVEILAGASWAKLVALRHARITHLMSGDLARVSGGVFYLMQASVSVVMLIAQCALSLVIAPALAVIALVMLAVIAMVVTPLVRRSHTLGGHVTAANLSMLESTAEFLGGLKLAMSQNLQASFVEGIRETLGLLTRRQVDNVRQTALGRLALSTLAAAVAAVIVLVGFGALHTPVEVLITLLLIVSRMSGPVSQLQQGAQQVAYALPAYEHMTRLSEELAAPPAESVAFANPPFPLGPVAFEGVSFRHPGEGDTSRGVRRLDLVLEPGEFVGVEGPSGAGKTTFVDLLVGLLQPQTGRITVGGRLLTGEVLAGWRAGLSYVSQDPFLFHDTVRRNLVWANPAASEDDMWRCLALAGADDLVRRMEHGLDSIVGERGGQVSGGERQRIALARALLRSPRLLVLDEATNAIDIAAERAVIERLERLEPRPTVVIIAHRLESLALCQRVLRLEDGMLAASAPSLLRPWPAIRESGG